MKFTSTPRIISMSDMIFDPVWSLKEHINSSNELLHVIKGRFELNFHDGQKFKAEAGNTLFVPKGTLHRDSFNIDEELEIFIIMFNWEYSEDFFRSVKNNFKNSVSLATRRQIRKIFDIMRLDKGSEEIDREVANCRLMNILVLLYREVCFSDKTYSVENDTDSATLRHHKLVAEAQKYIEKNYATPLTLQVIADHLQVSSFYLSRIFSRESEFCLSGYLTSVRISAAEKLLKEGRYIVSDVAGMVGYENSGYFSRVFKKHTGMSPKMYQLNQ